MTCNLTEIQKQLDDLQRRMDAMEKYQPKQIYDPIKRTCPKCNISLENSVSYSCTSADCPCGLGSPT